MQGVSDYIKTKLKYAEFSYSYKDDIERAFLLGLWHSSLPDYVFQGLDWYPVYSLRDEMQDKVTEAQPRERDIFRFAFIADTGDSWHQCYRDFRNKGWERAGVHREGGRLQYLLTLTDNSKPDRYRTVFVHLDISISTCKQVQIGTQTVPVTKTVCEDLVELPDIEEAGLVPPVKFDPEEFLADSSEPDTVAEEGYDDAETSKFDASILSTAVLESAKDDIPARDPDDQDDIPF